MTAALTTTFRDAKTARREASLREIREACERDGLSPRMIAETEASMRSAFAMADAMDAIFGSILGERK